MKSNTLENIIIGGYAFLLLAFGGLYSHQRITNYLEDKSAVVKKEVSEGNVLNNVYQYVAFSRAGNGEIDEIKAYGYMMTGGRALASLPYTLRYHKGESGFAEMKQKLGSH